MVWNKRYAARETKARKIITILKDHLSDLKQEWRCIDIGCGSGEITAELAQNFKCTVGLETKLDTLRENRQRHSGDGLFFILADGVNIPVANESINIIICAQVYEHVSDAQKLVNEIWKKLKPNGVCFFSGPNKWTLLEEHYWLPFLSWLPREVANIYMRLFKRGNEYDIKPMSYWGLRKLFTDFHIIDYSLEIIRKPKKYSASEFPKGFAIISQAPPPLLRFLIPFLPNFNFILIKQ